MNPPRHFRGPRHIAAKLNNYGAVLHNSHKFDEAAAMYKTALKIMNGQSPHMKNTRDGESRSPTHSPNETSQLIQKYDYSEYFTHDTVEFDSLSQQQQPSFSAAMRICENQPGMHTDDTMVAVILYNMALLQFMHGNLEKSATLYLMALSLVPANLSRTTSMSAVLCVSIHHNLGVVRYQQKRNQEAIFLIGEAVCFGVAHLGNDLLVALALSKLGGILASEGFIGDAAITFEEASKIYSLNSVEQVSGLDAELNTTAPAA